MIIRKIDGVGDWAFGGGLNSYATAEQAIEENVSTRIKSWKGDCFFAPNEGVDWKNRLESGQQANLTLELKSMIANSYGIVSIDSVNVTFVGRTRLFTGTYTVTTFYSSSFTSTFSQTVGA